MIKGRRRIQTTRLKKFSKMDSMSKYYIIRLFGVCIYSASFILCQEVLVVSSHGWRIWQYKINNATHNIITLYYYAILSIIIMLKFSCLRNDRFNFWKWNYVLLDPDICAFAMYILSYDMHSCNVVVVFR